MGIRRLGFALLFLLPPGPVGAGELDPGSALTAGARLAPLPTGDLVAVWQRERLESFGFGGRSCPSQGFAGAVLSPDGTLRSPSRPIPLPGAEPARSPRLAATGRGELALAWSGFAELRVGRLTQDLRLTGSTLLTTCRLRENELVAAGEGFWAVWSESCPLLRVRAQRLGPDARPVGPPVDVADPARLPGGAVGAAGREDGGLFVTWVAGTEDSGRRVFGTSLDARGRTVVPLFPVSPPGDTAAPFLSAASTPDGGAVVAWNEGFDRVVVRRVGAAGTALGPPRRVAAAPPVNDREPLVAVAPAGQIVVAWNRLLAAGRPPLCPVRVFDLALEPLTGVLPLAEDCYEPTSLAVSATGALVAAWEELAPEGFCGRVAAAGTPQVGVAPPEAEPIVSPAVPGFRFWVRIGGDGPAPRIGSPEPLCPGETVCVSGALPGRAEVLVRVVGPKPNGRLWPHVVRFTTSRVEVWIQRVSTGVGRYYRLEAPRPGETSLDGLFDRRGFEP